MHKPQSVTHLKEDDGLDGVAQRGGQLAHRGALAAAARPDDAQVGHGVALHQLRQERLLVGRVHELGRGAAAFPCAARHLDGAAAAFARDGDGRRGRLGLGRDAVHAQAAGALRLGHVEGGQQLLHGADAVAAEQAAVRVGAAEQRVQR